MSEMKHTSYGTIGIIAAMQMEAEGLIHEMKNAVSETVSGMTFTSGLLMDRPVVVAVSGEGKVNAAVCAQTMILRYSVGFLLNSGVAGNLSDTLSVGDVAIAADTVEHDYDISPLGYAPGMVLGIDRIHVPCDPDAVKLIDEILSEMQVGHLVGTVSSVTFKGLNYDIIVDFRGFKWLIQTTDFHAEGSTIGILLNPEDIHIMHKSEYSGMFGDYSSYSAEYDELTEDADDEEE